MDSLTEAFYLIDDFYQAFALEWEKRLLVDGHKKRCRATFLCCHLFGQVYANKGYLGMDGRVHCQGQQKHAAR